MARLRVRALLPQKLPMKESNVLASECGKRVVRRTAIIHYSSDAAHQPCICTNILDRLSCRGAARPLMVSAQVIAHGSANFGHRVDQHLVRGDMPYHAGLRHVRAGDRVHGPDHIALMQEFHRSPPATGSHTRLSRSVRSAMAKAWRLFGGAAAQLHQARRYGAGSADLGLAAALAPASVSARPTCPNLGGDTQRADGFPL